MDKDNNTVLGGFEAILDSFVPNMQREEIVNKIDTVDDDIDDDEIDEIKKSGSDPIFDKLKGTNSKKEDKQDELELEEQEEEDVEEEPKRKQTKPKKEDKLENLEENIEEIKEDENVVTTFFDALAEKLGWEFDEEESKNKPKDAEELLNYFLKIIEEESKPTYASEEIEALDNFVKLGGDITKYLTIEAELNLEELDIEEESNQKLVIKQLLKEKGSSDKVIEKKLSKYEEAGLLEDEAQDAIEELKEIKEKKKEQLLKEQQKVYAAQLLKQQQFYNGVVNEIKGLNNIRGIAVPDKDKKVLMDYILKPDTDGKTKYQKDYIKGGVKNLIESAYFTMNANKLIEAAKKEGNNAAVNKFKNSLRSNSINTKSKTAPASSEDSIWSNLTRQLRIS